MDELAERIKASLENPNGELWFPELTDALVARAWESLQRNAGLTPESYGTERVLSRSLKTPREVIRLLKTCPSTCGTYSTIAIEALSSASATKYQKQGVSFYSGDEILGTTVLSCIEEAFAIINQVPSLMKSVAALVRSLHVIRPEDENYDVSFSEPRIPFSIFVSVPKKRIRSDALRVAEAIIHEAMHLQLTLIERVQPLIREKEGRYFSPWRREYRNAQGLIHALYVFRVIAHLLVDLNVSDYSELAHASGRRSEISAEINQIRSFSNCSELTKIGAALVGRLLNPSVMDFG